MAVAHLKRKTITLIQVVLIHIVPDYSKSVIITQIMTLSVPLQK
jgi:hypothetical protein